MGSRWYIVLRRLLLNLSEVPIIQQLGQTATDQSAIERYFFFRKTIGFMTRLIFSGSITTEYAVKYSDGSAGNPPQQGLNAVVIST
jgi:hypothetical protein